MIDEISNIKKKIMEFKTPYNANTQFADDLGRWEHKAAEKPSQTIPDQSLSVSEIMRRYSRGLPLGGQKVPVYEGDEDYFPDLSKMDLADRQQYLEDRKEEFVELQGKIEKHKRDLQRKQSKAKEQQLEFEKWQKEQLNKSKETPNEEA